MSYSASSASATCCEVAPRTLSVVLAEPDQGSFGEGAGFDCDLSHSQHEVEIIDGLRHETDQPPAECQSGDLALEIHRQIEDQWLYLGVKLAADAANALADVYVQNTAFCLFSMRSLQVLEGPGRCLQRNRLM